MSCDRLEFCERQRVTEDLSAATSQDTLGARAPSRGCLPSRPTRRLSAVRDAWRVTVVDGDHQAQRGNTAGTPLIYIRNIEGEKSEKKSLATEARTTLTSGMS